MIEPGTTNPFTNVTAPPFDSGDSTLVQANDDVNLITGAGSIALGQKAGVGASIALNYLDRDTEAYIGNAYTASSGPTSGSFQSGGPIAIDATNTGYVYAVAVAGAVAQKPDPASSAGNSNPPAAPVDTALDLAVAVAVNTISDGDLAYINGATVQSSAGISLDAEYTPYFDTFTIGGSVNTTAGQTGIAQAGAFSFNDIEGLTVESFITQSDGARSVMATGGNISLKANDGSAAYSDAGAVSFAWSGKLVPDASDTVSVSMGISIAEDNVGQHTADSILAYVHNSKVTATGSVTLNAQSTAKDQVLAVGGAISGATGPELASNVLGAAGGGAYAAANISNTIETYIDGGSDVTTALNSGGSINLTATDSTKLIDSDAFGVAGAYAVATGVIAKVGSVAIGVGIAQNSISNTVESYITASRAVADAGITVDASSSPNVNAMGIGVAAAVSRGSDLTGALAGAGSAATNSVNDTIAAYITACTTASGKAITAGAGGVSVTASDTSNLTADAAEVSLAAALAEYHDPAVAIAVGASIAENNVGTGSGESIKAYIDGSDVTAAGPVHICASSTSTINTLAIGGSIAGTKGEGITVAVAASGAGTYSTARQTISASIQNGSSVTTTNSGSVTVTATDSSSIRADAGGVSISVAYGKGTSVSGSVGAANANNTMNDKVTAFIDSSLVSADGGITVQAQSMKASSSTDSYRVDALAFGVAFSGAGSTGNGASIALDGAGSSATNTIDNNISAYINNCGGINEISASGNGLSSSASALVVSAGNDLSVRADSGGYALAIASSTGGISGAVGIGAAESKNEVGQNGGDSVLAYISNSSVVVTGPLTVDAVTTASFEALGIGFSGAGAGTSGSGLTGALAGAGAGTLNNVAMTIEALIDGGSSVTAKSGNGLTGNVSLTATDNSQLTADAGGVAIAIAAGLGEGGGQGSLTVGASVANNTVANTVHAAIISSMVHSSGSVAATAQTVANPDKTLTFAPSAVNTFSNEINLPNHGLQTGDPVIYNDGGGTPIGGLTSGQSYFAIVVDSNTIELALSKADAIASTPVPITLTGTGTSSSQSLMTLSPTVAAFAIGGALSASGGEGLSVGFAGAGAGAINTVNNDIEAYIQGCSGGPLGVTAGSGGVTLQADDDSVIHAETGGFSVALAIGTAGGAGSLSVGASKSDNEIGKGSGQFVKAFIDSSTVTTPGTVSIVSLASAQIDSLAMGGSGSGAGASGISIAGAVAGAVTINNIEEQVTSAIQNSSSVTTSTISGAIDVYATDASIITADAGGVAIAIAFGADGAGSGSVGFAQANNTIDNHVTADISASQAAALGDVSVLATSVASISALSFGGSGAGSGGSGLNVALAGAGAGANNTTGDDIYAFINNCQGKFSVSSVLGSLALGATDNPSIVSSAGGGSVAISAGSTAAGVAVAAVQTNNTIGDTVESYIDSSVVQALADEVTVEATTPSSSHIKSLGVAASVGGGASVASLGLSGGGAGATNMITDTVQADVDQSSSVSAAFLVSVTATDNSQVTTTVGSGALAFGTVGASIGVSVQTTTVNDTVTAYINSPVSVPVGNVVVTSGSTVTITGLAVATSVALGGGAFAGSGANTQSTIEGTVSAYVGSSGTITVPSYGDITVKSTSTQNAQSNSYGASLAGGTVSVAIGVSLGTATIDGTTEASMSGTVDQGANLTVEATNSSTAGATIYAIAGGLGLGGSGAGANGTVNLNPIVTSYIDGTVGTSSSKRFDGDVLVLATSQSAATANSFGVAVGGAVAVGVSLAKSEVDPQVSTYIGKGATIHASGSISVETFQNVDINGTAITNASTAIAQASAGSLAGTGTGASANADNSPTVSAYVAAGANLYAGDGILIQALANNVASAQTHVIAVSIGASVGASLATATAEGGTEAFNDGSIDQSGSAKITAQAADTAETTAFAAAGGIASGSGDVATSTVVPMIEAYNDGPTLDSAGAVNVTATDTPEATATGFGASGSATIDVGVSQASATDAPTVTASAGGSGDSITAGSLSVTATMAIPSGASNASSEATGSAGASSLSRGRNVEHRGQHGKRLELDRQWDRSLRLHFDHRPSNGQQQPERLGHQPLRRNHRRRLEHGQRELDGANECDGRQRRQHQRGRPGRRPGEREGLLRGAGHVEFEPDRPGEIVPGRGAGFGKCGHDRSYGASVLCRSAEPDAVSGGRRDTDHVQPGDRFERGNDRRRVEQQLLSRRTGCL